MANDNNGNETKAKKVIDPNRPSSSDVLGGKYIYDVQSEGEAALKKLNDAGHEFRLYEIEPEGKATYYVIEKNLQMAIGRLFIEQFELEGNLVGSTPRAGGRITEAKIIETIGSMSPEARKALLAQFAAA